MKLPITKPDPNYKRFVQTIKGEIIPERPPFAELFLDMENVRLIAEEFLGREWVMPTKERAARERYWDNTIAVYHALGYDYVRVVENVLNFYGTRRSGHNMDGKDRSWTEENAGVLTTREAYDAYDWPEYRDEDAWDYEYVSTHLPDGMGMVVCPSSGFLEVPMNDLMGYMTLCIDLKDDPQLVSDVFAQVGRRIFTYYEKIAALHLPNLFGFFQGDDMGYKSATLISPDDLRRLSLPWHKKTAEVAHKNGLIYMLHSCGNLETIMEDLIEDIKIDAKHSYEDAITPVAEFHAKYGGRIGILGGVDLDKLCTLEEKPLRAYVRGILDACAPKGRYALGSGNSVANYVPIKNYLIMLEEGWNYGR